MEIALFESFPFIAVEPNAFAAFTMIQRKAESAAHQILNHAKTALGTVYVLAGLDQGQAITFTRAFGEIWAMTFQPFPVCCAADPVATAVCAAQRRQMRLQICC